MESRTLLSATSEWVGGGLTNYITDSGNYANQVPSNGDTLRFVSYASQTAINNNASGLQLAAIDVEAANASITGNPLALYQNITVASGVGNATVATPITIIAAPGGSLALNGGGGLNVSGNISGDAGVTTTGLSFRATTASPAR